MCAAIKVIEASREIPPPQYAETTKTRAERHYSQGHAGTQEANPEKGRKYAALFGVTCKSTLGMRVFPHVRGVTANSCTSYSKRPWAIANIRLRD
jgi:hypothetical protein